MAPRTAPVGSRNTAADQRGGQGSVRGGPALGRPLVDTVRGSTLANLKELRPGSTGSSEVRLLFVFDPIRQAVLLVGGDKSGNWQRWYRTAIPIAESAYADHLRRIQEKDGE
ncbi:type II toxin-antitoxin system RelE/ParE family toxin [Dactylosporangium sucinum]|uniref:Addiction module toxin RelE n=1 Tax=Dactylosporangium sucinum TaxID=1424081 RepID=A0A917UGK4_9ACTN|nr:type II toxin-antitoxin system RelE/ParE family toxin [Dactylosporangium sucinum]GGM84945.1 hypothetical protein GCM10007977_103230 [Dactylosporangium sucinum]